MIQNVSLESKLLLTLEGDGTSVFTTDDAKDILKTTDSSVWHILNRLVRKNRIERIERGRYLLIPAVAGMDGYWSEYPWVIVPRLVDSYYVGFWTAMNFWDMTEQIPYTVFVATTKRKQNMEYCGQRFEFVTLAEKKFFGFVEEKSGGRDPFNVSSEEKTIVDGLMHSEYCGGMVEVTKAMWNARKSVDWQTVLEMAERVEIDVVLRRLGYLLSVLDIEKDISAKVRKRIKPGPRQYLDSMRGRTEEIEIHREYGLTVNIMKDELLAWMYS